MRTLAYVAASYGKFQDYTCLAYFGRRAFIYQQGANC